MFGYDWPRLHAALNDLPAALLLVSVAFDLAGTLLRRPTLRAAGYWTLLVGVIGTAAAVLAGEAAEGVIAHSDQAHALMERHETVGLVVLALFAGLALWRLVRRGDWRPRELPLALGVSVLGAGLLVYTASLGGRLVFDHALGIPTSRLPAIVGERGGEAHEHQPGAMHDMDAAPASTTDSTESDAESRPHTHDDSSAHSRKREED